MPSFVKHVKKIPKYDGWIAQKIWFWPFMNIKGQSFKY
jgi:hypothetical protein